MPTLRACLRLLLCACLAWLPAAWPAAGEGVIAILVAPGQNRQLDAAQLAQIYKRKKLFWPDGSRIQPVNLPLGNRLRREFSLAVLGAAPEELEQYWNDQYFHGIAPPYVLSSSEAMLRFVADNPNALGYAPYCSVAGRAKILLVIANGRLSDDTGSWQCGR